MVTANCSPQAAVQVRRRARSDRQQTPLRILIQPGDDRATRPAASVAGIDQGPKSRDDLPKRVQLGFQGPELLSSDRPDLGIAASGVAPQLQERAYSVQREAEVSRPLDEAQPLDVGIVVIAVAARAPRGRRQEPNRRIILAEMPDAGAASLMFMTASGSC